MSDEDLKILNSEMFVSALMMKSYCPPSKVILITPDKKLHEEPEGEEVKEGEKASAPKKKKKNKPERAPEETERAYQRLKCTIIDAFKHYSGRPFTDFDYLQEITISFQALLEQDITKETQSEGN
jgi:hypothetical protein